jgi:hypothetical protein
MGSELLHIDKNEAQKLCIFPFWKFVLIYFSYEDYSDEDLMIIDCEEN